MCSVAEGAGYSQPADYEDIDSTKPTLPPADMFANSINDYSRSLQPFEMSAYEVPVQTTISKVWCITQLFVTRNV